MLILAWVCQSIVYAVVAVTAAFGIATGKYNDTRPSPTATPTPYIIKSSYEPDKKNIGIFFANQYCADLPYPVECKTWCYNLSDFHLYVFWNNRWVYANQSVCTPPQDLFD